MYRFATLAILLMSLSLASQPTLDQFLSQPTASGLAVSSDGQVAWIQNDQGKRNIFLRSNGRTSQLTTYTQDDGQELVQLTFSPDGQTLVYVRGGDQSREGYSPNPSSLASGVEQAIWLIHLSSNDVDRMTAGSDPVFYPDGKRILCLQTE